MTEEKYKKLNSYLNDIFLELEKSDSVFLEYLYEFSLTSELIYKSFNYSIKTVSQQNNLTFEEVFLLAREVIEKINKDYLKDYDNLLNNGVLDFGYNGEYNDSHYLYSYFDNQEQINIRREFCYDDVENLVHEFMHFTNVGGEKNVQPNTKFLTEFISIYFEEFTRRYLIEEKKINIEEINSNGRIVDFLHSNIRFYHYCLILLAYEKLGNLTSDTPKEMKKILNLENNIFEKECLNILEKLEEDEKNLLSNESLSKKLSDNFRYSYRYIVGTLLAFYALEHCNFEDVVKLNLKINTEEYINMNIEEVLNTIGFELSYDNICEAIECVKKNIKDSKVKR